MLARVSQNSEYASFAYSVAVFGIASVLLDFGFNIAAIKIHSLHKHRDIPTVFASMKLYVAFIVILGCTVTIIYSESGSTLFAMQIGLLCAAINNVWLAIRVSNQSAGDAKGFFNANMMLSGIRITSIALVWFLELPAYHFLLGLYVYPYLLILPTQKAIFSLGQHFAFFSEVARETFSYAKWIFLSAVLFGLSLQLPVLILKHNDRTEQLGTLGVAMTVASFSSWLSYSLKPFFIGRYLQGSTALGPYLKLLGLFCLVLIPATFVVYFLINLGYSDKFDGVGEVAVTVFLYTSLVFIFGLYNGQIHVAGRPELEALVNFGRAMSVLLIMLFNQSSLLVLIFLVGSVMIGFELLLMMINYKLVHTTK